jgi:hypothetical protein
MRKVNKITVKETIGFEFTTNDLVSFESNSKKGIITITGDNFKHNKIVLDITEQSALMLSEFFRYVLKELKESDNDKIKTQ